MLQINDIQKHKSLYMAGDVCQNYAKYFDNDVLTLGNDSDYFMGTIKHLVTISNYSTTKKNNLLLR